MSYTHDEFSVAFLKKLGLPVRTSGKRALACVYIYESSEGDNRWFNPLACTLYWPGATPYNTFGNNQHVWRYATFQDGVDASAQLFSGPHWDGVRQAIKNSLVRGPILDAFSNAYSWANIDFRHAPWNTISQLDERRAHILR